MRDRHRRSWPLTFGKWAYTAVASGVVVVEILNRNETPGTHEWT